MKEMFLGKTLAALMLTAAGTMTISAAGFEILRINPEDGAEVNEISLVEWWSNNDDYTTDWSKGVEVYDAGGNRVGYASDTRFSWDDYTYLAVEFSPAITAAGDYTVVFPAGLFLDSSDRVLNTEDITYTYHVTGNGGGDEPGPVDPVPAGSLTYLGVVPAEGKVDYNAGTEFRTFNIIFDEELEVVDPAAVLTLVGEDGKTYESESTQAFNFKKYGEKNMLIVRFGDNAPIYSGTYTMELPAGFIRMSGGEATNEAMSFSWEYIQDKNLVEGDIQPDETPLDLTTLTVTDKATGELIYDLLDPSTVVTYLPYGDAVLNIGFDRDQVFGLEYAVHNVTKDEYVTRVWTYEDGEGIYTNGVRGEDGLFHFNMGRSTELEDQFEYELEIHAFYKAEPIDQRIPKGSAVIPIKAGGKSIYYNRDIEVLDITPEVLGTMSAENNVFTVTFSEPVEIVTEKVVTPSGTSEYVTGTLEAYVGLSPFMAVVPNVDKTVWSFTVSPSFMMGVEGAFVAQVAVNDMNGLRVVPSAENCSLLGFSASEAGVLSRLEFTFCAYDACREIVVEPGAGVVESIYSFTFSCPSAPDRNLDVQYIDASGKQPLGVLRASNGARIATLITDPSEIEYTYDQDPDAPGAQDVKNIALTLHLDREITAPGHYYLDLVGGYFMTGTEYSAIPGKPVYLEYIIEGDVAIDNTSLVDGDNVSLLSMVSLYIGGDATVADGAEMTLYRAGDRRRAVASAPLRVTAEGAYSRVYADFCDSENGFASLKLDPRDDVNEGMGQNYDLVVEKGAVSTADGMEFSEKVITIHTPGAAESGSVETATFIAQFPYHQATIANVINGEPVQMMLMPGEGWKLDTVLYNGEDVTETVTDNMLVTPAVQGMGQVDVLFTFDGDIQFLEATGILDINDSDYRAFIDNGEVVIEGLTGGEFVQVYNLGGALISMYEPQSGKDTLRISLPAGTYVITIDGRHAIKVNI